MTIALSSRQDYACRRWPDWRVGGIPTRLNGSKLIADPTMVQRLWSTAASAPTALCKSCAPQRFPRSICRLCLQLVNAMPEQLRQVGAYLGPHSARRSTEVREARYAIPEHGRAIPGTDRYGRQRPIVPRLRRSPPTARRLSRIFVPRPWDFQRSRVNSPTIACNSDINAVQFSTSSCFNWTALHSGARQDNETCSSHSDTFGAQARPASGKAVPRRVPTPRAAACRRMQRMPSTWHKMPVSNVPRLRSPRLVPQSLTQGAGPDQTAKGSCSTANRSLANRCPIRRHGSPRARLGQSCGRRGRPRLR